MQHVQVQRAQKRADVPERERHVRHPARASSSMNLHALRDAHEGADDDRAQAERAHAGEILSSSVRHPAASDVDGANVGMASVEWRAVEWDEYISLETTTDASLHRARARDDADDDDDDARDDPLVVVDRARRGRARGASRGRAPNGPARRETRGARPIVVVRGREGRGERLGRDLARSLAGRGGARGGGERGGGGGGGAGRRRRRQRRPRDLRRRRSVEEDRSAVYDGKTWRVRHGASALEVREDGTMRLSRTGDGRRPRPRTLAATLGGGGTARRTRARVVDARADEVSGSLMVSWSDGTELRVMRTSDAMSEEDAWCRGVAGRFISGSGGAGRGRPVSRS